MLSKRDCLRKIKKPADVAPLPSAKKICPVMTPIDLDELIKLYILQKNYHEIPDQIAYNGITHKQVFQKYYEDLCDKHGVILNVDPCLAPAMFTSQPNIPFILFNTAAGQRRGKQPLIIHTHGGPHVYIPPDLYHAEIAYFLSQGFVVACPNYRGSSGYSPAHTPPAEWIKLQEDFENIDYEITGPEDVYTVAVYMSKKHGIDPNKIFLRGGSFGSFINAQLLKQIDQKKFKNIFCGVHLSGGVSYPAASSLPVDIPILITHGLRDPIASCDKAFVFMDNMLLFRELYLTQDLSGQQVETFIAETGNHHLIDPRLEIDDLNFYFSVKKLQQVMMAMAHHKVIKQSIKCQSPLEELERYLSLSTGFITGLLNGTYQFTPLHDQVIALAAYRDPQVDPELAMQATEYVKKKYPVLAPAKTIGDPATTQVSELKVISIDLTNKHLHFGPTKALLKLYLGQKYTGNIGEDLSNFLTTTSFFEFPSTDPTQNDTYDGSLMTRNKKFFSQVIEMIETEEACLRENPTRFVAYHAASGVILFLYNFIDLWTIVLSGNGIPEDLDTINNMRFYDFITKRFSNISDFRKDMESRAKGRYWTEISKDHNYVPDLYYYYVPKPGQVSNQQYLDTLLENIFLKASFGPRVSFNSTEAFKDRALACNPSLLSNNHSTASWSLWWYFKKALNPITVLDKLEIFKVINLFLDMLGLDSSVIISDYYELFNELISELEQQAIMQQIFIPYELVKKIIYMCQLWGVPFVSELGTLDPTKVVQQLILNPELLEKTIRDLYKEEFFNFEQNPNFGKPISEKGIYFVSLLQLRVLLSFNKSDGVDIKSYVRSQEQFINMVRKMSSLVRKHFANYLTNDTLLSDAVMLGADREKNNFLVQYGRNSSKPQTVSLQILYELHKKLTAGLLRRCDIKHIIDASKSQNAKLQKMLQEKNSPPCVDFKYDDVCKRGEFSSIFKLCSYIEGFTYYGLVIDAVDSSSKLDQKEKQQLKELVDELCNSDKPSFNTKLNVSFDRLLRLCVDEYKYVPDEHEIINKKECNTLVEREQIVAKEINMAARSILLEFNRKYSYMHYQSHQRL